MAVDKQFAEWYNRYEEDQHDGCLRAYAISDKASALYRRFEEYKREMNSRVKNYHKLVMLADAEVISPKPDLANVSSGEVSGMVLRMARNLVQHTPNVEVVSKFDDDDASGRLVDFFLKTKIIGDDLYSNDMQQNLFASTKNALTLGFDCVIPVLQQDGAGTWCMQYDSIYYQDVFPEPGSRDIRRANDVFVRRYLTRGDVKQLIRTQPSGWDITALRELAKSKPPVRQIESVDNQSRKHHTIPDGYEIITWYSSSGNPFLTFDARSKLLLRVEKNKHPLKWHPVFFLILEKDTNQPLGRSQIERVLGRQEFQDLLLNGAMKLWYRNINPPLIGYGTANATINLSPGKFNMIGNPNARVEPFEVSTQTLLQYGTISQQNAGNMVQQTGAADQQMASQSTGGMMSQTPQGVEAQQAMVDITTNNFQKAIESFFSRYCSYALTIYFQELKGLKEIVPTADSRRQLIGAGVSPEAFDKNGALEVDFSDLAIEYFVKTVPGSLVEMEDERQARMLNELFIPLSQAMPAVAAAGDQEAIMKMSAAMQYIVQKQLQLSGSLHAKELDSLMKTGMTEQASIEEQQRTDAEAAQNALDVKARAEREEKLDLVLANQQEQLKLLGESVGELAKRLGMQPAASTAEPSEVAV